MEESNQTAAEVVLAQRLASGEPVHRRRALALLRDFISVQSKKTAGFSCGYEKSKNFNFL
jgi:hypothetical protein